MSFGMPEVCLLTTALPTGVVLGRLHPRSRIALSHIDEDGMDGGITAASASASAASEAAR